MTHPNVDLNEIEKFDHLSAHWWDTQGELKTLHGINPFRVAFIQQQVNLAQKKALDVGCGGGILAESLAQHGAAVTGIDMSDAALKVARLHLRESGLQVNYELITAEQMAEKNPQTFDVVTCLEMLEHVPDPAAIVTACAQLVKPGGHVFFSTLNRTVKSYLFAIVGAEYVLRLIPKNTHEYAKFIRPSELENLTRAVGLSIQDMTGMTYNPFTKEYGLTRDVSVNYLVHCIRE